MKDAISVRQICFILIAYNGATKLLLFPSYAANAAGNALIFSALFNLLLQTVIIWSVAYLSSKTDNTFFGLMRNTFGAVTARVIYALFALFFLMSAIIPMNEQQLLVHDSFYDTIPALVVFLPFFIFSVYAGVKSFTNVGRCADICLPVFLISVAALIIMSFQDADYTNLLPILKQPFKNVAGLSLSSVFRFSESAFLLMFMGHYKYKKGDAAKLTISYAFGGLIVIMFLAAFYAAYGVLSPTRSFAVNTISLFFSAIDYIGRIDLIAVYTFDIVALFAIVLNIQACVHCLCYAFNREFRIIYSLTANAVLLVITFFANNNFSALQSAAGKWFWIPAAIFAYLIPVLAWALRRKAK